MAKLYRVDVLLGWWDPERGQWELDEIEPVTFAGSFAFAMERAEFVLDVCEGKLDPRLKRHFERAFAVDVVVATGRDEGSTEVGWDRVGASNKWIRR